MRSLTPYHLQCLPSRIWSFSKACATSVKTIKSSFREMGVEIIPIDEHMSSKAVDLVEQYTLSHSMELADALIASTCLERGEILFTANDKHYKMIDELRIEVFRP